jgi:hypothetical protein
MGRANHRHNTLPHSLTVETSASLKAERLDCLHPQSLTVESVWSLENLTDR